MDSICALLNRGADNGPAVAVVLSVERASYQVELLKSVDVRLEGDGVYS
jgi:hypothetical protein